MIPPDALTAASYTSRARSHLRLLLLAYESATACQPSEFLLLSPIGSLTLLYHSDLSYTIKMLMPMLMPMFMPMSSAILRRRWQNLGLLEDNFETWSL
jgi:hypothetical protein